MSLDTYANLKDEIIDWSHRDDLDLKIDTFIDLAETEMYANDFEILQIRDGETRVAFSTNTTDRYVALPTGYIDMREIHIQIENGDAVPLVYNAPVNLNILSSVGLPHFFTISDQIELDRVSDQVYNGEILYNQEFTPLSDANTSNAVLTNFPNIYLFGALWALKKYTEQPQSAADYYQQFISAIQGANEKTDSGQYGPAPQMKVSGSTP